MYVLKIVYKGKNDAKKITVGISRFKVGTEFGGSEFESIEMMCGTCGRPDNLKLIDEDEHIFQCGKFRAKSKPDKKDLKYF